MDLTVDELYELSDLGRAHECGESVAECERSPELDVQISRVQGFDPLPESNFAKTYYDFM